MKSIVDFIGSLSTPPAVPHGFSVKHVEGHGWIIDPPNGSRWVAFEGTPAGDFMAALGEDE